MLKEKRIYHDDLNGCDDACLKKLVIISGHIIFGMLAYRAEEYGGDSFR